MEMNQSGQSSSHIRESCLLALVWKANSPVLKTLHKEAGGVTVVSLMVNQPESNYIWFRCFSPPNVNFLFLVCQLRHKKTIWLELVSIHSSHQ